MIFAPVVVALDLAALESGLSVAGAGVSAFAAVARLYNTVRTKRGREPQRKALDLHKVTAYFILRSVDTVRIPSNLEIPGSSRASIANDIQQLHPEAPEPLPSDLLTADQIASAQRLPRLLHSRHLYRYRQRLHLRHSRRHPAPVSTPQRSVKSITKTTGKRPWWQREHVYNVLSSSNELLYTIERHHPGVWIMYSYPARDPLVTIRFRTKVSTWGPNARAHTVEFHEGASPGITDDLKRRKIRHKSTMFDHYNVFYTSDGAPYHWAATTRRLERVINWRGKSDEIRECVGSAKPLQRGKMKYELLIDGNKIDPVVALSTGFVSMKTQWINTDCPVVQSRTKLP
ncbi:uncharacterized protein V2V93DRAFT_377059 [Kockiozyma suomiensis]|uniref:uncharacterized protein n=1 Tax=Kockiozyma suomiensis TaxID=1337062 RepID=UPI003344396A